ncbi:hypothetical protein FVD15_01845 [Campylobacter volucris]|uniref:Sugar transferase n=1 Tax=Campylobacter volucris TaxID=1031542 RepID=A0AAE5YHH1_9BACT|nr:hypothetical protein [Campylobacter volucris]AJC93650.1 hypothetical protein CVOL_0306 [Campylobacter volucris LMG 24379]KAB0579869.1 hypothetical protein F7P61_03510 [Campylobacter volucris]QBL13966.1 hypothetical protein A9460_06445 [Campylobacter volucris]QEL07863.1 hypothetical protein CVOLT_0307 [Campylobacter volucris]TXK70793.1 hypothetical protein FVD15_01845 [Campylobacter volucris]
MENNIEQFITKIKKGLDSFKGQLYDYQNYNCEMASFANMIKNYDVDGMIKFWNDKQNYNYFELQHPIYNNIKTKAVYSIQHLGHNYVFFADETNEYIWCGIQGFDVFNYFIVEDTFYTVVRQDWRKLDLQFIGNTLSYELLKYKEIDFGFTFDPILPLTHFFDSNLVYIYSIIVKKFVQNVPSYFIPKHVQLTDEKLVFLRPIIIMAEITNYHLKPIEKLIKRFAKGVYNDALSDSNKFLSDEKKYDLTLWLGLTYRNGVKTWLNQVEASINIIQKLQKTFKNIRVYVDGLKERENILGLGDSAGYNNSSYEYADCLFKQIANNLNAVDIINLNNCTVREAICICSKVDIAIADVGAGSFIPFLFCQKPTIMYGNHNYIKYSARHYPDENTRIVKKEYSMSIGVYSGGWDDRNYCISWEHIYNLAVELLEQSKQQGKIQIPNKMEFLNVTSVELLVKQYELKQELKTKLPNLHLDEEILKFFSEKELNHSKTIILLTKENNEKDKHLKDKNEELKQLENTIQSLPIKKQQLEIFNLEQDLINKKLQTKQLFKKLDYKMFISDMVVIYPNSAKQKIQNQLSYKLGQAMIINSKSLLGYLRMPFVLSYIKDKHHQEQKIYKEKIKKDPSLAFPPLESYPDYQEALKEKECFTYRLGQALLEASKEWYKGGYIKLLFEIRKLKKEIKEKK